MAFCYDVLRSDGSERVRCARLEFEEYSFQAEDGRVIGGYTCSLRFPWGQVKLVPKGLDSGSLVGLLNLAGNIADIECVDDFEGGE